MKSVSSSTLKLLDIEVSSSTLKLDKSDNHRIKTGLMEDGVCGMETGGGGGLQNVLILKKTINNFFISFPYIRKYDYAES